MDYLFYEKITNETGDFYLIFKCKKRLIKADWAVSSTLNKLQRLRFKQYA